MALPPLPQQRSAIRSAASGVPMDNCVALPKILSEAQVAELLSHLGVNIRLVRLHRKMGFLECVRFSNRKFGFLESAVAKWVMFLGEGSWLGSKKTNSSNIVVGGLNASPAAQTITGRDTSDPADESAAKALAQTILGKQRMP